MEGTRRSAEEALVVGRSAFQLLDEQWALFFFYLILVGGKFKQNTIGKLLDVSFQVPRQSPLCQRMVRPGPTLQVCVKPEKVTKLATGQTQAKNRCNNLTCLASPRNV